jgi:hypothetical protein
MVLVVYYWTCAGLRGHRSLQGVSIIEPPTQVIFYGSEVIFEPGGYQSGIKPSDTSIVLRTI